MRTKPKLRTNLPFAEKLAQRVKDVTNLNMEASENLQISNYGIGGQYGTHVDFGTRRVVNFNRVATWLFYVSTD